MAGLGGAHYLKPVSGGSTPGTVMFLTCAVAREDGGQVPAGALERWDMQCVYRRHRRYAGEVLTAEGRDQDGLAAQVDAWATTAEASWLYTYDALVALNASRLAEELCALGWELSRQFGTSSRAMWLVLHKGARTVARNDRRDSAGELATRTKWAHTITLADARALSVLSARDGEAAQKNVGLLSRAVLALMNWWDGQQLGRWSVTGAALGWRAYRATLKPKGVVIDHDPVIVGFERRAIYGGRRDVAVVGTPGAPAYAELDFERAYPTIAAHCMLPCAYGGQLPAEGFDPALYGNPSVGLIAEVTLATDHPRWPARIGGKVFYPIGTFRTVLAGPDLADAWDAGVVVQVHEVHWYRMSRHMAPWGAWIGELMSAAAGVVPEPVRRAAKHWSRCVIGKFAQRGWTTRPWVGPPCDGWVIEQTPFLGKTHQIITIGLNGVYYLSEADQRGDHERPAVLAFVEAHVRQRLSRLLGGRYAHAVVQWDTDGMIVSLPRLYELAKERGYRINRHGTMVPDLNRLLGVWSAACWPLTVRCKTIMERMVLYGPQHVVSDAMTKLAGVPSGAVQIRPGVYVGEVRPRLARVSPDDPTGVGQATSAEFTINGPYSSGWVLADGSVRSPEARIGPDGSNELLPWPETRWARAGALLGPLQALWTDGLAPPQVLTLPTAPQQQQLEEGSDEPSRERTLSMT
jgi:hypothetical protein